MHHIMPQSSPVNIADVPEELHEKALKRTADMLRKLEEIRHSLEMPADQLTIVIDTYNKAILTLIAEQEREERAKRTMRGPLTMQSRDSNGEPMKLAPGKKHEVVGRPQFIMFQPEDFAIHGDRSRWIVHDIMVGNRSQFVGKRGPAHGTEFGPGGILEHMRLESVHTAMDFTLVVEYVGPEMDGEVFEATVVGTTLR